MSGIITIPVFKLCYRDIVIKQHNICIKSNILTKGKELRTHTLALRPMETLVLTKVSKILSGESIFNGAGQTELLQVEE